MAFVQRPDGLIDVDTPMGPLPMAPDVAMQLGWTPGTAEAGVQGPASLEQQGAMAGLGNPTFDQLAAATQPPAAPTPTAPAPMQPIQRVLSDQEAAGIAQQQSGALLPPSGAATGAQAAPQAAPSLARQIIEAGPQQSYQAARPAGWVDQSRSLQGTAPITGEARQRIEGAQDVQLDAQRKSAQAEGAVADALTQQANAEAMAAKRMADSEAIRRQRIDSQMAEMQAKREELRQAVPDEIDPGRWNKIGGAGAILAAVSVALGGIAQGLAGGDNQGMATINGLIQRDIQAQKDEIALAQDSADTADNDLQRYMDIYGDPILAEKQLEMNGLETMKKEMQARVQGAQSEQAKALAAQGIAALEEQIARSRNDMDGRAGQLVTSQAYDQGQSGGMVSEGMDSWLKRAKMGGEVDSLMSPFAGMNEATKRDAISRIVALPDGRQAFATTTADAQATNKLIGARSRYVRNLEEMRKIIRENAGRKLDPELQGRMKAMVQENKIALKDTNELGAITASDAELVTPLSGEGILDWSTWDANTIGSLDEAQKYVDGQLTHRMGNLYSDPMASPASQVRSVETDQLGARDAGF